MGIPWFCSFQRASAGWGKKLEVTELEQRRKSGVGKGDPAFAREDRTGAPGAPLGHKCIIYKVTK